MTPPPHLQHLKTINSAPKHLHKLSAWRGHTPFAITLVEILKPTLIVELGVDFGTSLMAFAQGIHESNLQHHSQLHGIDLWATPNRHERALPQLTQYIHQNHYHTFTTLHKAHFHHAVNRFPFHSIQLLHIDGLHDYHSVASDFFTYLPKLDPLKSITLLHDSHITNQEPTFAVHKLCQQLKPLYPHIEFHHSYGLTAFATGFKNLPPLAKSLFSEPTKSQTIHFFTLKGLSTQSTITIS